MAVENVTVYCGSATGNNPIYSQAAEAFCRVLLAHKLTLVYGGASVGLMNVIANTMLAGNGRVLGCITEQLAEVEIAHENLTRLVVTNSLNERKAWLAEKADAFVMLPGAAGSLDEFFDIFTQAQLGYHEKPIAILNTANYYDTLIAFIDHSVSQGFMKACFRDMLIVTDDPEALVEGLLNYQAPHFAKWRDIY